ncbi:MULTISPECIES: hypothetical protein [Eisenbergiella]|uniref:hypothetical protein n=1 Tax=Eisenbergiella TaxID=1432051 RepID=UPI0015E1A1FE|nr:MULTISPECIES: hypothetical protein [Eisenbergiella]
MSDEDRAHHKQHRIYYHIGGIYNYFILWLSHNMKETSDELSEISASIFSPNTKPKLIS